MGSKPKGKQQTHKQAPSKTDLRGKRNPHGR